MKILITGAKGFIGKNLVSALRSSKCHEILEYDIDTSEELLKKYCMETDFIFHLAGVNRPTNADDFMKGNYGFSLLLLETLKKYNNKCPMIVTSSIQASLDNPYGESKKAGENILKAHYQNNDNNLMIYRLPNVFGKWCRPNYNSVVATFCNNIANGLPITVSDPNIVMNLVYIDDVMTEFLGALEGKVNRGADGFCSIHISHTIKLGEMASLIKSFNESRSNLSIPNMADDFTKKLYATYLSYLPKNQLSYPLKMNCDHRGSFTEIIRTPDRGQFSVNITKPGIIKGNHWHHTKNEKFVVVSGKGIIRFRNANEAEIIEYYVSGDKMEIVDIPPGYTHHIENIGETDLVIFMWANEAYDPDKSDTIFLEIQQ